MVSASSRFLYEFLNQTSEVPFVFVLNEVARLPLCIAESSFLNGNLAFPDALCEGLVHTRCAPSYSDGARDTRPGADVRPAVLGVMERGPKLSAR
jgi:hypothetical protein